MYKCCEFFIKGYCIRMASPQKENGYTPIANEILDALCAIRIPGEARQVLDVVIRKTYGFNKKEDQISSSQICKSTGINKQNVYRATQKLIAMNLVIQKDYNGVIILSLQKDFEIWKPLSKKITQKIVIQKDSAVINKDYKSNPKRRTQKTKDTFTKYKGIAPASGAAEKPKFTQLGAEIIKAFEAIDPKNKKYYENTTQRSASDFLIEEYSLEKVLQVIALLPKTNKVNYFPKIYTPHQLKESWQSLMDAFQRKKSEPLTKGRGFVT